MAKIYQGTPTTQTIHKGVIEAQVGFVLPRGNSPDKPTIVDDSDARLLRTNSDTNELEYWDGTQWVLASQSLTDGTIQFRVGESGAPVDGATSYTNNDMLGRAVMIYSQPLGRFLFLGEDYTRNTTFGNTINLINGLEFLDGDYYTIVGSIAPDGYEEVKAEAIAESNAYTDDKVADVAGGVQNAFATTNPSTYPTISAFRAASGATTYTNFLSAASTPIVVSSTDLGISGGIESNVVFFYKKPDGFWEKKPKKLADTSQFASKESLNELIEKSSTTDYAHVFVDADNRVLGYLDIQGVAHFALHADSFKAIQDKLLQTEAPSSVYFYIMDTEGRIPFYIDENGAHYKGQNLASVPDSIGILPAKVSAMSSENDGIIKTIDLGFTYELGSVLTFPSIAKGYLIDGGPARNERPLTNSGWTHPSVLFFPNKWNGFEYWCAITPYPDGIAEFENPHIFCSHDGQTWIEPAGISNPIQLAPPSPTYSSDVNLILGDDEYLYCYWRDNGILVEGVASRAIYYKKTRDGINWSERVMSNHWPSIGVDMISPSLLQNGKYLTCYAVATGEPISGNYFQGCAIRRSVTLSDGGFTTNRASGYDLINVDSRPWGATQEPWHIEVRKVANVWLMLVTTTPNGGGGGGGLYLGYSFDGWNFKFSATPLVAASTYKSSFLPVIDLEKKTITCKVYRAMMTGNWTVFLDKITINFS